MSTTALLETPESPALCYSFSWAPSCSPAPGEVIVVSTTALLETSRSPTVCYSQLLTSAPTRRLFKVPAPALPETAPSPAGCCSFSWFPTGAHVPAFGPHVGRHLWGLTARTLAGFNQRPKTFIALYRQSFIANRSVSRASYSSPIGCGRVFTRVYAQADSPVLLDHATCLPDPHPAHSSTAHYLLLRLPPTCPLRPQWHIACSSSSVTFVVEVPIPTSPPFCFARNAVETDPSIIFRVLCNKHGTQTKMRINTTNACPS